MDRRSAAFGQPAPQLGLPSRRVGELRALLALTHEQDDQQWGFGDINPEDIHGAAP
jgi:hypothetical protein